MSTFEFPRAPARAPDLVHEWLHASHGSHVECRYRLFACQRKLDKLSHMCRASATLGLSGMIPDVLPIPEPAGPVRRVQLRSYLAEEIASRYVIWSGICCIARKVASSPVSTRAPGWSVFGNHFYSEYMVQPCSTRVRQSLLGGGKTGTEAATLS